MFRIFQDFFKHPNQTPKTLDCHTINNFLSEVIPIDLEEKEKLTLVTTIMNLNYIDSNGSQIFFKNNPMFFRNRIRTILVETLFQITNPLQKHPSIQEEYNWNLIFNYAFEKILCKSPTLSTSVPIKHLETIDLQEYDLITIDDFLKTATDHPINTIKNPKKLDHDGEITLEALKALLNFRELLMKHALYYSNFLKHAYPSKTQLIEIEAVIPTFSEESFTEFSRYHMKALQKNTYKLYCDVWYALKTPKTPEEFHEYKRLLKNYCIALAEMKAKIESLAEIQMILFMKKVEDFLTILSGKIENHTQTAELIVTLRNIIQQHKTVKSTHDRNTIFSVIKTTKNALLDEKNEIIEKPIDDLVTTLRTTLKNIHEMPLIECYEAVVSLLNDQIERKDKHEKFLHYLEKHALYDINQRTLKIPVKISQFTPELTALPVSRV